ncbi:hypothetical protein MTR_1g019090 [Medicago truncatula]|uniref:RNA-directed DNA polymerase n=1 Tax=Medicago truncatula TaxID=3880 RepID=G7I2D7_MEDTR|nr:hypothetical protein MTR_1g019090 [Medicago truncatula]
MVHSSPLKAYWTFFLQTLWELDFAVMSVLKVNFHKSLLVGVNIPQNWLEEAANILYYKIGSTPFKYLGLSIGANPNRKDT